MKHKELLKKFREELEEEKLIVRLGAIMKIWEVALLMDNK